MKMFADELEAKAVDRGDVRCVEQGELLVEVLGCFWVSGSHLIAPTGETEMDAMAHFRSGGFGERDHQEFVQCATTFQQSAATFNECLGLARARARHHEDVAFCIERCLLGWGECAHLVVSGFASTLNGFTHESKRHTVLNSQ